MTDPTKPIGPGAVDAAEALDEVEATPEFEVAGVAATQSAQVDPLQQAIQEVAADIKAGRLPDKEAASEAVILRLVNLRFGHLTVPQRQKMQLHLHELLHRDPAFQARIDDLIAVASAG